MRDTPFTPSVASWAIIFASILVLRRIWRWYRHHSRAHDRLLLLENHIRNLEGQLTTVTNFANRLEKEKKFREQKSAEFRERALEQDLSNPENQLRFIKACELKAVRPVNKEAVNVLYAIETWIKESGLKWRFSFEVSMGSFIKTKKLNDNKSDLAFKSYNSKRVDFLIVDRFGDPKLVVEYNGSGHDISGDATERMAVKKLALEAAKIPLLEIPQRTSQYDIIQHIDAIIHRTDAGH